MTPQVAARLASWQAPCSSRDVAARIAYMQDAAAHGRGYGLAVVEPHDMAIPCGWVSAEIPRGESNYAMLTYWIGEQYQGLGLMRRAAPRAMAEFFKVLRVPELRAAVQPDNVRSISLLESLGFSRVSAGQIWCSARQRHESCFYYGLRQA
ncbi:RimJ/RimL family protein N-acetyltransferase [Humitalea rosea]|uniref:RimJ/RimL family protein N-acetyltransferase n=2 Tax=Humitalea rosea TaxID=990373 RepID=A0A2W7INA1_9PROT|nr:RimJ/RimL family protein N-acetyltransferase [Humitalea rosea]